MTFLNSLSRSSSISSFCDSKMEKVFGSFARKQWFPCLYCLWSFCLPCPLPSDLCVFSNNFCLSVVSVTPQFVGRFCSSCSQSGMMPGLSCWLLHRLSLSLHRQCRPSCLSFSPGCSRLCPGFHLPSLTFTCSFISTWHQGGYYCYFKLCCFLFNLFFFYPNWELGNYCSWMQISHACFTSSDLWVSRETYWKNQSPFPFVLVEGEKGKQGIPWTSQQNSFCLLLPGGRVSCRVSSVTSTKVLGILQGHCSNTVYAGIGAEAGTRVTAEAWSCMPHRAMPHAISHCPQLME